MKELNFQDMAPENHAVSPHSFLCILSYTSCPLFPGLGIRSSVFRVSETLVFCSKMNEWVIRSKKRAIHSFAHFWWETWAIQSWSLISSERPERIAHGRSFLVRDLRDLLKSLIFGEQPERFTHIAHKKRGNEQFAHFLNNKNLIYNILKNKILDFLAKFFWANRSIAHFLWATWANRLRSRICLERPEQFALGRSFPLSNLSNLLLVAHLSCAWVHRHQTGNRRVQWAVWTFSSRLWSGKRGHVVERSNESVGKMRLIYSIGTLTWR